MQPFTMPCAGQVKGYFTCMTSRWPSFFFLVTTVILSACGDCKGSAEDADAFVRQAKNQECDVDEDCVLVDSHCSPMETADCSREVSMNADAAASEEWKDIASGLDACRSTCSVCPVERIPHCDDGYCRTPD